jgi:hypothetical protein
MELTFRGLPPFPSAARALLPSGTQDTTVDGFIATMGLDVMEIGMGADLSLDLRHFASKAVRQSKDDTPAPDMDACIRRLEEERGKIEMFKRDLPLCARLLADGERTYLFSSLCLSLFLFFPPVIHLGYLLLLSILGSGFFYAAMRWRVRSN